MVHVTGTPDTGVPVPSVTLIVRGTVLGKFTCTTCPLPAIMVRFPGDPDCAVDGTDAKKATAQTPSRDMPRLELMKSTSKKQDVTRASYTLPAIYRCTEKNLRRWRNLWDADSLRGSVKAPCSDYAIKHLACKMFFNAVADFFTASGGSGHAKLRNLAPESQGFHGEQPRDRAMPAVGAGGRASPALDRSRLSRQLSAGARTVPRQAP